MPRTDCERASLYAGLIMALCNCEVNTHGQRQLELQVKYPLASGEKRKRYQLDLFVFSPYQLGMTRENYGVSRFLQDMKSYTRYSTYSIPISKLADLSCSINPVSRIAGMLKAAETASEINEKAMIYELRILATIYGRQLRDTRRVLRNFVREGGPASDAIERLVAFLTDMDLFLHTFRALRPAFLEPRISDLLRQGLRWADEAISLGTEKTLYKLHDLFMERGDLAEGCRILEARLGREQEYRMDLGYPTIVKRDDPVANERFVYREGVLKKWTEGCMFMTTEHARIKVQLAHLLMSIAAGAAMAFAVVVTLFASRLFAMHSVPWAILIVIAYIAKDRIKEILRGVFAAYLPKLVADQVEELIDPAIGTSIGSSRARAIFCHPDGLPEAVRNLRNIEGNVFRNIVPPENVIHFHKDVCLDSERLMQRHKRLESLTEIMRLKLNSWLENMDDPVNTLSFAENGRSVKVGARRVYHLYLIVGFSETGGDSESCPLFGYRLVLTRNGIVRIERVAN